jgi:hypothetical protein
MNKETIVCETCNDTRTILTASNLIVDCPDCAVCEHCNGTGKYFADETNDAKGQTCICQVTKAQATAGFNIQAAIDDADDR